MMGNKDVTLPNPPSKIKTNGFHRGLKEDYRIFKQQPEAPNTKEQPVTPEGNTGLFPITYRDEKTFLGRNNLSLIPNAASSLLSFRD